MSDDSQYIKKFEAQRKNILELENELDYCKQELINYKKSNKILNHNIDLLREQMEELEIELRKYKRLKQMGDIEGA
tara:strand:- start:169 stop:396 length:228 start_codon:yes stop_codon:yes gene_type:complete